MQNGFFIHHGGADDAYRKQQAPFTRQKMESQNQFQQSQASTNANGLAVVYHGMGNTTSVRSLGVNQRQPQVGS